MKDEAKRAIGIFLNKTGGPVITYLFRTRTVPTKSQIERELAQKYGEIAGRMAGHVGEVIKPKAKPINVSYCLECCQRHFGKAHGLLEEAERFSLKEGKLTSDAAQKVRKAVEELVTSEDDLDSTQASPEVRKKLDEIKDKMRDVRKNAWEGKLSFEGASLDALSKMKTGVDDLATRTYDLMAEAKSFPDTSGLKRASDLLRTGNAAEARKWVDRHLENEECSICKDELKEAKRLISRGEYGAAQDMINEIIEAYMEIQGKT